MKRQRTDIKKIIKRKIEIRHNRLITIDRNSLLSEPQTSSTVRPIRGSLLKNEARMLEKIGRVELLIEPRKKVNVIISAYRAFDFIEECLDSIQNQTQPCDKILLGVDGCTETLSKVVEIGDKYPNLEIYFSAKNKGPYQMFNALIELVPNDGYFQIFGADDVMNPNMLEQMSKYNTPIVSRNDGILFIKKETFKKIGGFRAWRCAADSDMIFRLGKLLNTKIARAPQYFFRREHDGQLTKLSKTNHKSKLRKQYIAIYEENKKSLNPDIYIEPICSKIVRIIIDKKENLI